MARKTRLERQASGIEDPAARAEFLRTMAPAKVAIEAKYRAKVESAGVWKVSEARARGALALELHIEVPLVLMATDHPSARAVALQALDLAEVPLTLYLEAKRGAMQAARRKDP